MAFAVYYIKALDWSAATGDPAELEEMSSPACRTCQTDIENLRRLTEERGYLRGARLKMQSSALVEGLGETKADYIVKFVLLQEPVIVVLPTATDTQVPDAKTFTSYLYVSWTKGRWAVVEREGT